jgi:hypothetical protein
MTRPTEAQDRARMRNWGIRNLRALYALSYSLTGERRTAAHDAIDAELALRGAEPEGARKAQFLKELEQI